MARSKLNRRKTKTNNAFDIEAVGLVILAVGVFLLGLVIPQLPKGEWGEVLRLELTSRIGWGAFTLPWPFVMYGSVLLLGKTPKHTLRRSSGYFLMLLGIWSMVALARPDISGHWGANLRGTFNNFTGWLSYLAALFITTLGVDVFMSWPLAYTSRTITQRILAVTRKGTKGFLETRRQWKVQANFYADVSLTKNALSELDKDLKALTILYPGNAEVSKWRKAITSALRKLKKPTVEKLNDADLHLDAWEQAIADFAKVRAEDLKRQLATEGISNYSDWLSGIKTQLDNPIQAEIEMARPLENVRQALVLDQIAMQERYHNHTRRRDQTVAAIADFGPRELVTVVEDHQKRIKDYQKLVTDVNKLEKEANILEGWRELCGKLEVLLAEFHYSEDLHEVDALLAKDLKRSGRKALIEFESWEKNIMNAERSTRAGIPKGVDFDTNPLWTANKPAESDDTQSDKSSAAKTSSADNALAVPPVKVELIQKPLPSLTNATKLPRDEEQERLFRYARDLNEATEASDEAPVEIGGIPIQLPSFDLLDEPQAAHEDPTAIALEVQGRVKKIDATLNNFKLEGRVASSVRGPSVTRFEVEPAPGEKISRFANLSDDLALAMAVGSVRIEAPIPGKSVIGLEVPNARRDLIKFREAVESPQFRRSKHRLPILLGKNVDGEMEIGDLARMPHLLIAGSTGSGKSVAVNTIISSLLYKFLPTELRFLMIDPKMVELTPFDGIPHMVQPVITNPNDAAGVLLGAVAHMERRYKMMSKIGAKTLDQYNDKARNLDLPEMPIIVIVIDELADLMITSPKEVESAIMRLAQMARATGMHLILATQRPSVDILTSLIKVNVPARMAFAVSSGHDSRTILDTMGAERLIGMGDMLFAQPGMVKPSRIQGPFISEEEVQSFANFLRRQYFDDEFGEAYAVDFDPPSLHDSNASGYIDWNDDKLRDAAELVIAEEQASVSRLQRRLMIGHARAGKLMDSLEALGVVGEHRGSKPRDVLVTFDDLPEIFGS